MKIMFVGESFSMMAVHLKGFDHMIIARNQVNGTPVIEALRKEGLEVTHMSNEETLLHFPHDISELKQYDAIIISDCGSNNFLLHPDMQFSGKILPNRLKLIRQYVEEGGGLLMCGGYMSFAGYEGKARYGMTPLADVLPVKMLNYDDRMEHPESIYPRITKPEHPIFAGIGGEWPWFCGYNKLEAKPEAEVLAVIGDDGADDVFIAVMEYGKGRSAAFSSDCVTHWASRDFMEWEFYGPFFKNVVRWIAGK